MKFFYRRLQKKFSVKKMLRESCYPLSSCPDVQQFRASVLSCYQAIIKLWGSLSMHKVNEVKTQITAYWLCSVELPSIMEFVMCSWYQHADGRKLVPSVALTLDSVTYNSLGLHLCADKKGLFCETRLNVFDKNILICRECKVEIRCHSDATWATEGEVVWLFLVFRSVRKIAKSCY